MKKKLSCDGDWQIWENLETLQNLYKAKENLRIIILLVFLPHAESNDNDGQMEHTGSEGQQMVEERGKVIRLI